MLSDKEKELIDHINNNRLEEVRLLLNDLQVNVNKADDQSMTPLLHAAFKGNYEIVRLLIERGANVNYDGHKDKYSALHFAAIGGFVSVVTLLLENGANPKQVNYLGRTASQMAAFVNQMNVVETIRLFTPTTELEYYTKLHGLETEPKLKKHLLKPFSELLRVVNVNPVRVLLELNARHELLKDLKSLANVLESMCDKEMNDPLSSPNQSLALRFWYLAQIFRFYDRQLEQAKDKYVDLLDNELALKTTEVIVKNWIDGRKHNGFPFKMEEFLRTSMREYKYRNCPLFIAILGKLASVKIGDEPSAWTMIRDSLINQKGFTSDVICCSTCGEINPEKKCSNCKSVNYCNKFCQKCHWPTHKEFCEKLKKERELNEINHKINKIQVQ